MDSFTAARDCDKQHKTGTYVPRLSSAFCMPEGCGVKPACCSRIAGKCDVENGE